MKYLKSYNEEWNPIEWAKKKKEEISKGRREKSIMQNTGNVLVRIKMPVIKTIQVKSNDSSTDSSIWKTMDFTVKTNQFPWDTKVSAEIDFKVIIDENDVIIRCGKIDFNILGKVGEAKGPGRRRYVENGDYFNNQFGTIRLGNVEYSNDQVISGNIIVELGRHNIEYLTKRFEYDEKTLSDDIKEFINSFFEKISDFYKNVQISIKERREKITKDKENREKHEVRIGEFFKNEETIKECFLDLIDMSDEYNINSDKNSRHIKIDLKIKGIDVNNQKKSKYTHSKNTSVYFDFDEAHINVTDELFIIMRAIQNSRSHLESIDKNINMETVFKKDNLLIILSLNEVSN